MIEVTTAQMYGWIATFLWPMFRMLGLISSAPLLSESTIPRRLKILLAAALSIIISPTIGNIPTVPVYSLDGLLIVLNEVGIGLSMGFAMRLVFAAVQMAGEVIGLQMGLSFASFYDRAAGGQTMVLSRFLNMVAMLLFSLAPFLHQEPKTEPKEPPVEVAYFPVSASVPVASVAQPKAPDPIKPTATPPASPT